MFEAARWESFKRMDINKSETTVAASKAKSQNWHDKVDPMMFGRESPGRPSCGKFTIITVH